ncbi:MAG: hypothetical protein U9R05_10900 [Chloroflexota bacterium]|nr:hypothetical protein [Chloroflexota bacterium]
MAQLPGILGCAVCCVKKTLRRQDAKAPGNKLNFASLRLCDFALHLSVPVWAARKRTTDYTDKDSEKSSFYQEFWAAPYAALKKTLRRQGTRKQIKLCVSAPLRLCVASFHARLGAFIIVQDEIRFAAQCGKSFTLGEHLDRAGNSGVGRW